MRAMSTDLTNALAAAQVVLVQMLKIDFPSGTVALNSSNWDFTVDGTLYRGAYGLGTISPITDKPGEVQGVQLEISRMDAAFIALALDEANEVQGSPVRIFTAVLSASTYQILDVLLDWLGHADTMSIAEDGQTASIGVTTESKAVDLLRGNPLTYSDADQQALVPGDRAFEYVVSQADQQVVWPTKAWFYV